MNTLVLFRELSHNRSTTQAGRALNDSLKLAENKTNNLVQDFFKRKNSQNPAIKLADEFHAEDLNKEQLKELKELLNKTSSLEKAKISLKLRILAIFSSSHRESVKELKQGVYDLNFSWAKRTIKSKIEMYEMQMLILKNNLLNLTSDSIFKINLEKDPPVSFSDLSKKMVPLPREENFLSANDHQTLITLQDWGREFTETYFKNSDEALTSLLDQLGKRFKIDNAEDLTPRLDRFLKANRNNPEFLEKILLLKEPDTSYDLHESETEGFLRNQRLYLHRSLMITLNLIENDNSLDPRA